MTKEEKQRIYDAMLIRAWRKDVTMDTLRFWLRPYDLCVTDEDLIRTSKYLPQRVVRFVGQQLKPLGDKLFDGDPTKDIDILNWLTKSNLKCQNTERIMHVEVMQARRQVKKEQALNIYMKDGNQNKREEVRMKERRSSISRRHY